MPTPKRQARIETTTTETKLGYGYGYVIGKDEFGIGIVPQTDTKTYEDWQDIPENSDTSELLRDVYYKIKLYKINNTGQTEYKLFDSIDDIEPGYKYFDYKDLFAECYSEEYYQDYTKNNNK